MSVTDLTNTVWKFDDTLDYTDFPSDDITLNFTDSDSNEYIQIGHYGNALRYVQPNHAAIQAYNDGTNTWITGKQTINIVDGTDVTNSDVISWLESNATYLSPLALLFQDIADAIRVKNSLTTLYYPSQMPSAILSIPTGSTINNQDKTVTPTESQQSITADSGYTGLGTVTVNAISSSYVGSGITRRSSSDLLVNENTVTVPIGYYASSASGSVPTMTLPTSTSSSATSGYTSKATIGRSTSNQYINIPTGYNSSGAYYLVSATPNGSVTAPSTISGTSATVSTGTNTLTLTKTVSVTPSVTTAGYISSGTAGNASVSLTASITTKSAATYYPSTTQQTISASQYLTGIQTIAPVTTTNLVASNILDGVTIKVGDASDDDRVASVTGNVVLQNYYTGSSAPSSSLGNNGDLYLQT